MSGHSKWSTIKHKKAKEDAKRGKIFTKLIREITVAAQQGGGDPAGNARLRLLVEKAKKANMPHDNIMRAIKKGTGELDGVVYQEHRYEGYGPGGIAVMVDVLTDNKNRTVAQLRHHFSKYAGNLAETGSVNWLFDKKGIIILQNNTLVQDDLLEKLIEYPIDDITYDQDTASITCDSGELESVKSACQSAGYHVVTADISWVAKDAIRLQTEADSGKAFAFLESLEDLDDVQRVHTNLL